MEEHITKGIPLKKRFWTHLRLVHFPPYCSVFLFKNPNSEQPSISWPNSFLGILNRWDLNETRDPNMWKNPL